MELELCFFTYSNMLRNSLVKYSAANAPDTLGIYVFQCNYKGKQVKLLIVSINVVLGKPENQLRVLIHLHNEGHQLNCKDVKLIHKSANPYERNNARDSFRKLLYFNPSAGPSLRLFDFGSSPST